MFSWYYIEGILIQSCYTLLIVLGLSILTGYTGMFSFGHAGFVCIGAYVSVICTMAFGLPYWPAPSSMAARPAMMSASQ